MEKFEELKGFEEVLKSKDKHGFLLKLRRNEAEIIPNYLNDFNWGISLIRIERAANAKSVEKFVTFFEKRKRKILNRFEDMGKKGLKSLFTKGMRWALDTALGEQEDMSVSEFSGVFSFADPSTVSYEDFEKALNFITDFEDAKMNFFEENGNLIVSIACGGSDFSKEMISKMHRTSYQSDEGRRYYGLLGCLANYAWARRQILTGIAEMSAQDAFGKAIKIHKIADLSYNLAFDDGTFFFYKLNFPSFKNARLEESEEELVLEFEGKMHRMVRIDD